MSVNLDIVIGGEQKHQAIKTDGISTCLTSSMGTGGGYIPMIISKAEVKVLGNLYGEDRGTGFAGNVWDKGGLCPTITTMQGGGREPMIIDGEKQQPKIIQETKCVGGLSESKWGDKQYHQQNRVYKGDIALAHAANIPGGSYHYLFEEGDTIQPYIKSVNKSGVCPTLTTRPEGKKTAILPICCAMRGRNPEKPTSRIAGLPTEQRLEVNEGGVSNTLTTVQKDNLVMIPTYRIRKLTPKECWRLMGYTDEDFDKAKAAGVSNSQLYKQAGNAIVKQVLMAIFKQMNIKGVK